MYGIMRRLKGYTHLDFMNDEFTGAQYFVLLELVNHDVEKENRAMEKAKEGKK